MSRTILQRFSIDFNTFVNSFIYNYVKISLIFIEILDCVWIYWILSLPLRCKSSRADLIRKNRNRHFANLYAPQRSKLYYFVGEIFFASMKDFLIDFFEVFACVRLLNALNVLYIMGIFYFVMLTRFACSSLI